MRIRLQRDVNKLKKSVVELGTLVEERFQMAVRAVARNDLELATRVTEGDLDIDQTEVDIEEECLKILALHQPVADNLRYIIAVLKMNNDLERIGDLAVNIAERAGTMSDELSMPSDILKMAEKAGRMLKLSLDSLINSDIDLAYRVCAADDEVDAMKNAMQMHFLSEVKKDPALADSLIASFLISRHLERIADHATNIAEDVIYMVVGEIHRHRSAEYSNQTASEEQI